MSRSFVSTRIPRPMKQKRHSAMQNRHFALPPAPHYSGGATANREFRDCRYVSDAGVPVLGARYPQCSVCSAPVTSIARASGDDDDYGWRFYTHGGYPAGATYDTVYSYYGNTYPFHGDDPAFNRVAYLRITIY